MRDDITKRMSDLERSCNEFKECLINDIKMANRIYNTAHKYLNNRQETLENKINYGYKKEKHYE